jgi:hypothetical protein
MRQRKILTIFFMVGPSFEMPERPASLGAKH